MKHIGFSLPREEVINEQSEIEGVMDERCL